MQGANNQKSKDRPIKTGPEAMPFFYTHGQLFKKTGHVPSLSADSAQKTEIYGQ
jgi:hypothetical protein